MSLYDGIKDVAKVVQQADNIELYKQLLELGSQALDMQDKIGKLTEENAKLRSQLNEEYCVHRHKSPYITLESQPSDICYCAACWGKSKQLIQMNVVKDYDEHHFECSVCGLNFYATLD